MSSHATAPDARQTGLRLRTGALVMAGVVVLLWVIEGIDTVLHHSLDGLGIRPRAVDGLPGIVLAPFLHVGWEHLVSNTVPLFVLGTILWAAGVARWVVTTVTSTVTSGLAAWLLSAPNSVTIGASGVIFGWLTYLVVRGIRSRDVVQILIGVVIFLVYGSVLWGVLPSGAAVSWQGHLGGAAGGVIAAVLLERRSARVRPVI